MKKDNLPKTQKNAAPEESANGFLIVGIGASAGGIQALRAFFEQVTADSGIAYVVILHLSPDHDSKLAEVLQTVSKIPVLQVTEKVNIEPDHVYVIPPDKHLTIDGNFILVNQNTDIADRHAPVDIFFRSLAEAHGQRAICVVLSGTGANGSMGLKRIKEVGGAAFVQNPREAEFNEMPRNSIATNMVDEVLPVAEIPARLLRYSQNLGLVRIHVEPEKRPVDQQQALREIFAQLRLRTGHDFTNYKRPTLLRRIERRITVHNVPDLAAYAGYMQQNPDETTYLLKDLLISVTNFFRDKKAFETLEKDVLPAIIKTKKAEENVRIWVAGCASGEEAYSIAMLCAELTENVIDAPKIQIFATDIDEAAIAHAREGLYSINEAADVSPERLRRFFRKEAASYRIRREIREIILFANHNFIKDPPFSHLDLISCRNVLIYLNHTAQERVMETFHFALSPGGYLFVGSSESADGSNDLYTIYNREHHVFRSREVKTQTYPLPEAIPAFHVGRPAQPLIPPEYKQDSHERISYGDLHQQLLEKYASPSILINEEHNIIHLSDRAGKYLHVTGGEPTQNLLKMVRPELRLELRSALYQATQRKSDVEARGLKVNVGDKTETINIHVRPVIGEGEVGRGFILVLFEQTSDEGAKREVILTSDEPMARQLEEELIRLKAQLRSSNEQHEFQAEELKAANEELQAMNEETRSVAEELETSKEELQSINEELRTVNQELKIKVEETTVASNNLQNLINSVDLATIFLDRSLRINFFSPAARDIFNLIPADHGRQLSDITDNLDYKNLTTDAELVLDRLQPVEKEIPAFNGHIYQMRVLPYRTAEDHINGVVITFYDITRRKQIEKDLKQSEERLRLLIESAKDYAIFTQDTNRRINSWNKGAEYMFGYTELDAVGQLADIFFVPEDREKNVPQSEVQRATEKGRAENERWHIRKDGSRFYGSGMVFPLYDNEKKLHGFVKIMRDLTEDKRSEAALRESEERLRIMLESANDYAIITLDTNGNITSWSKGAETIFGYFEKEVKGRHTELIFTPEDRMSGAPAMEMLEARHTGRASDERWHLRKDGSRFYMSGVMTPIISNDVLVGFVKVARDLTDRKLMEQQKDEFIGVASHELKTPITSIKAYTELLLEIFRDSTDIQNVALLDKLDSQVNRLINLINSLLDTTRISEGKLTLHKEKFDMNELIAEHIHDIKALSLKHNLIFHQGTIKNVTADRERIGQVVVNLISNAIKYSPNEGDIIINTAEKDHSVEVSVQDFGVGIPEEFKGKIFERFYRIDNASPGTFSSMGLGLYISLGIIERHGGNLSVESKPGKGACFRFNLPYDGH